jgi:arylsulfatase A-like enzyme
MNRAVLILTFLASAPFIEAAQPQPNFVIIFCDDLGYGDLGCFGHPTIRTPHLDRMAAEGMKFTQFYSGAEVCTPSRAALLTGRLPPRNGMCSNRQRVLFPGSQGGLPGSEITLAENLKENGYATACIGKWHLGHLPAYLPTMHGFDEFFGLPYSNDMDRVPGAPAGRAAFNSPSSDYWNVPLMRNEEIIERPADQTTLTNRYTEEAIRFIRARRASPFFLYMAHTMPHVPLFRSQEFKGESRRGLYGDVVEEIDHSVGRILAELRENGLDDKTLVIFTSDNGPWLTFDQQGGSAGLLREGKGSTWEGGMREPMIAWWPGRIEAGTTTAELASTMDLFATCCSLAGAQVPEDRPMDSFDLSPVLLEAGASPRENFFYYRGFELMAVRWGPWKAHFLTQAGYGQPQPERHDPPLLFHLEIDPAEKFDVSKDHPDVLTNIRNLVEDHRSDFHPAPSQLEH